MPELPEEMYCSQQICIPPTFPYLLRQYAKAAIRSQPLDLLKWSTAYFRCLALNVPPPIKPRLEYPIPRDYVGITPGWLKALNYQLRNSRTVTFRTLWDRWMGSCLEHATLVEILCLGGFTNNKAIPWNRFVALCAGYLNDNLTQTMIMICEILTEEPEGGSAMVTLEVFLDLYKFLAAIDASQPRLIQNVFFTDDDLNLFDKEEKVVQRVASIQEVESVEYSMPTVEEYLEEQMVEAMPESEESVISCPDLATDDVLSEPEPGPHAESSVETIEFLPLNVYSEALKEEKEDDELEEQSVEEAEGAGGFEDDDDDDDDGSAEPEKVEEEEEEKEKDKDDSMTDVEKDILEKGGLVMDDDEDHDKLKGEDDVVLTDMNEAVMPEKAESEVEIEPEESEYVGQEDPLMKVRSGEQIVVRADEEEITSSTTVEEEEESEPEDVHIPSVPGIGPPVPKELVEAVVDYLTKVSAEEHGMTMPRHVRHYTCPPLEVMY